MIFLNLFIQLPCPIFFIGNGPISAPFPFFTNFHVPAATSQDQPQVREISLQSQNLLLHQKNIQNIYFSISIEVGARDFFRS